MRFHFGRTEVRISYGVIPFVLWCVAIGEGRILLFGVLSLFVHESAHLIAVRNLGLRAMRISVYPFGAVMRLSEGADDPKKERIVALAGPIGSATTAAFLCAIRTFFLINSEAIETFETVNLAIAVLNLIPAFPLDGGRIVRSLLFAVVKERTAKRIVLALTALCAMGAASAGAWLLSKGIPAWTLLALPAFLMLSALREWKTPDPGIIGDVLNRSKLIRCGEAQKAEFIVLSSDATIGDAVSAVSGSRMTFIRILDGSAIFELSENDLLKEAGRFGYAEPLKSVISSLTGRKSCVIIH